MCAPPRRQPLFQTPISKGYGGAEELWKSSENVVKIRTFGKSSYPNNIFKSSYVTPCPLNEAMYFTRYLYGGRSPPYN